MIKRCRHCERYYWRYRPDHPPRFFCSVPCFEARGEARAPIVPRTPKALLGDIHHHRRLFHDTESILPNFEDCETCEELESLYNQSLAWYMDHPESPAEPDRTAAALRKQRKHVKQIALVEHAKGAGA